MQVRGSCRWPTRPGALSYPRGELFWNDILDRIGERLPCSKWHFGPGIVEYLETDGDGSQWHACMYFEYALLLTFFQGCLESPGTRHGRKAIMPLGWAGQEGLASALFGMTDPAAAWNGPSLRYRVSVLNCKSIIAHRRALVFCFGVPSLPFRPRLVGAYTTLIHHRASCIAHRSHSSPINSSLPLHCKSFSFSDSDKRLVPAASDAFCTAPGHPNLSCSVLHPPATRSLACRRPFLHPRLTRASPKSDLYTLPLALLALVDTHNTLPPPHRISEPGSRACPSKHRPSLDNTTIPCGMVMASTCDPCCRL